MSKGRTWFAWAALAFIFGSYAGMFLVLVPDERKWLPTVVLALVALVCAILAYVDYRDAKGT